MSPVRPEVAIPGDETATSAVVGESRAAARRKNRAERTEKEKTAAVASAVAEATRAGALSGAPGDTPVGGDNARFVLPLTTKSAASSKDPKHGTQFICCRCCSWPVRHGKNGKECQILGWGGPRIHKCPGLADYHHSEYADGTLVPAAVLACIVVMGGSALLPETNTIAKQKVMHDLLLADGATGSAADWRKWAMTQKFGAANPPTASTISSAAPAFVPSSWHPAVHDNGSEARSGAGEDDVKVVGVTGSDINEMMAHVCFTIDCLGCRCGSPTHTGPLTRTSAASRASTATATR